MPYCAWIQITSVQIMPEKIYVKKYVEQKGSTAMLTTDVTPGMNLSNPLPTDDKACMKGIHSGLETKDRCH